MRSRLEIDRIEQDEYGTLAQVDAVCRGVSGPSERLILPACGHVPQRDRPEETLSAIVAFVKKLANPGQVNSGPAGGKPG